MSFPNDLGDPTTAAPDDLVARAQTDPVLAALLSTGAPVQSPPPPVVDPAQVPITSPDQVAGPAPPAQAPVPVSAANPPSQQPPTAAKPTAPSPPAPTGAPLASGDVNGATREQDAALQTETGNVATAELAKADALAAHANSRAQIYEGHATAQGLIDQQYQAARDKARADANAETAAWMRDLDQKVAEEPVPGRWWANQSKFGQVLYLLSLSFGALAQARNPNLKNIALELITKETDADVAEQRDRIKREIDAAKLKGQVIDRKLEARLADARDDHGLLVQRLAVVQQAALERANAPGPADQQAAWAEAAKWAGAQRLDIAGQRAQRAYAEREGKLNRDAENARAFLVDQRDRDLKAAELTKDYDLARIQASVKLSGQDAEKFKDTRVLNPSITGIRVVDAQSGQPVATPVSPTGGLVISTKNSKIEEQVVQDAQIAQDHYATLQRIDKALSKDNDLTTLLRRDPQLVSDLQKSGYQQARENDPRGIVTDKDYTSGLQTVLGGDLNSLSGRIASATFSASAEDLRKVVQKTLRDLPAKVSNRLGSVVDASIPGYQGNIRVDWTPKAVEIDEPKSQSTQQIDAGYGIKTPVQPPATLDDLKRAQELEKGGVQALPPYRPGSQDKVLKAIADFRGALPDSIISRAGAVENQLNEAGDQRAALEVQQAQYEEIRKSKQRLGDIEDALRIATHTKPTAPGERNYLEGEEERVINRLPRAQRNALDSGEVPVKAVVDIAKAHGITQLTGQDVLQIIERVGLKPAKE